MNTFRKRRPTTLLLLLVLVAAAPTASAKKRPDLVDPAAKSAVDWSESFGEAAKKAKAEHVPLLLKFYASWCPHCAEMDKSTWTDEALGELSKSFIAVKLNNETQTAQSKRYRIQGVPVTLVAEPGGEEVFRIEGETKPKVITAYLKTYLKHADAITSAFDRLREDRNDPGANLALGDFYQGVGLEEQAIDRYEEALERAEGPLWLRACAGAATAWLSEDSERARELVAEGLSRAGEAPPAALLLAKARVEKDASGAAAARPWFERVVAEHGSSDEAAVARKELAALGG